MQLHLGRQQKRPCRLQHRSVGVLGEDAMKGGPLVWPHGPVSANVQRSTGEPNPIEHAHA